jgi:hypothetical protein
MSGRCAAIRRLYRRIPTRRIVEDPGDQGGECPVGTD